MSWPGAVEVHQFVFELLAGGLGNHVGQGQVVNLQLPNQVKLGTFSASEVALKQKVIILGQAFFNHLYLVLVIFWKREDEEETVSNVLLIDNP